MKTTIQYVFINRLIHFSNGKVHLDGEKEICL